MAKFWELLERSVLMQALLAVLFGGTICYLYILGRDVPDSLVAIVGTIIVCFFGSKAAVEIKKLTAPKE